MRFFVTMTERPPQDPQERAAMLGHRLHSITYQSKVLADGQLAYAFRNAQGNRAILMYEPDSLEALDFLLKRDPGWQYTETVVTPVVSTEALVREAQDYLKEYRFTEDQLPQLVFPRRTIDDHETYWLAYKEVRPFNPLLSDEAQNEVHRRTILAQEAHLDPVEFADDNPVGKSVGILVATGTLEDVRRHVETCDVFPDTVVEYTELLPLSRAWEAAAAELRMLRRPVPTLSPFAPSAVAAS